MPGNYPVGGGAGGYPPNPGSGGGVTVLAENVMLLLYGNGTNGGTSFPDNSFLNASITTTGTITTNTNPDTSGLNGFDATSIKTLKTGALSATTSEAYRIRALPFTIEAFLYPVSYGSGSAGINGIWIDTRTNNGFDNGFFVGFDGAGKVLFNFGIYSGAGSTITSTASLGLNEWSHVAMVGYGNSIVSMYVNGVRNSTFVSSASPDNGNMTIGQDFQKNNTFAFDGYMNQVRLLKGVAAYSGDSFTIPSAAFPDANP